MDVPMIRRRPRRGVLSTELLGFISASAVLAVAVAVLAVVVLGNLRRDAFARDLRVFLAAADALSGADGDWSEITMSRLKDSIGPGLGVLDSNGLDISHPLGDGGIITISSGGNADSLDISIFFLAEDDCRHVASRIMDVGQVAGFGSSPTDANYVGVYRNDTSYNPVALAQSACDEAPFSGGGSSGPRTLRIRLETRPAAVPP